MEMRYLPEKLQWVGNAPKCRFHKSFGCLLVVDTCRYKSVILYFRGFKLFSSLLLVYWASLNCQQVNTYIIVPTADKYATSLGAASTLCGVIIGSMAVAQLVSSVYLSAWSNKSYYGPLIFSSIILCLGNLLYAVAYNFNSVTLLLIGRLLCG